MRLAIRSTEVGHQSDGFGFMVDAVLDSWQCCNNTLVIGNFVWCSFFLRNLFVSIDSNKDEDQGTLKSTLPPMLVTS